MVAGVNVVDRPGEGDVAFDADKQVARWLWRVPAVRRENAGPAMTDGIGETTEMRHGFSHPNHRLTKA